MKFKFYLFVIFFLLNCMFSGDLKNPIEIKARSNLNSYRSSGSFPYLDRACMHFASLDHTKGLIECKLEKGFYFIKTKNYDKAKKELLSGIDFSFVTETNDFLSSFYYGIGLVEFYKENYKNSLIHLEKATGEGERLEILSFRGFLYSKQGLYSQSKEDLLKSKISSNPKIQSKSLIVLAEIEKKEKNWKQSESYALEASRIDRENSYSNLLLYDYEFLRDLYKQMGDTKKETLYKEKLKILKDVLNSNQK